MRDDPIITIERILIALIAVLTGVSMYLTMQFGFNSGEEAMGLGLPAVTAAAIALWYIIPGVQNALARRTLLVFALFFSGMDAYTNIGASFAIKENELVGTTNKNEIADNLRKEIATKEDRIKQIQASQAWKSEYTATGAWEAEIKNLEGHFIFKRSKECTDQTLKTTFQHCEKWRSALAGLANAKARGPLQAEFDALTEQVTKDKASLVDHGGTHVSENATQIERITQLFSFNLQPGEDVKERAYLLMTALLGVVFSIAPAVMSYALRVHQGAPVPRETPTVGPNPWLSDYRPADARPLHAETVPGSHAYHNSKTFVVPGAIADVDLHAMRENVLEAGRMAAMAQEILKRKTPESV